MQRRRGHGGASHYQSYESSQPSASSSSYSSPTLAEEEYAESSTGLQYQQRLSRQGQAASYIPGQYNSTGPSSASSTSTGSAPGFSTFRVTGYRQQQQPIVYPPGSAAAGYGYGQTGPSLDPFLQSQPHSSGDPRETSRDRRRQQNRLAQRALRQRREDRLRHLESRIINARLTTRSMETENRELETQLQAITSQNRALRQGMGLAYPSAGYSSYAGPSSASLTGASSFATQGDDYSISQHSPESANFVSGQYAHIQGPPNTVAPDYARQGWSMGEFYDPAVWAPTQYGMGQQQIPHQQWPEDDEEGDDDEEEEEEEDGDDEEEEDELKHYPQEGYVTRGGGGSSSSASRTSQQNVQRWLYDPSQQYSGGY